MLTQALVDGEVWVGRHGVDTMTYDIDQVDTLPVEWEQPLVDPLAVRNCLLAWFDGTVWHWQHVDVERTIVRATVVARTDFRTLPIAPRWWVDDDGWQRKFAD